MAGKTRRRTRPAVRVISDVLGEWIVEWNGRFHLDRVDDWFAALTVRLTLKREQPASWPDVSSLPVATHLLSSLRTVKAPNFISCVSVAKPNPSIPPRPSR